MAIGDVGDDLSMAVVRESARGAAEILRFAGRHHPDLGLWQKARKAYDFALGKARALLGEEPDGGPGGEPGWAVLWAGSDREQKTLLRTLQDMGLDARPLKGGPEGLRRVRVALNKGAAPLEDGGLFAAFDMENPDMARIAERHTFEAARESAAIRAAARAAGDTVAAARKELLGDIDFQPGREGNGRIRFTVTRWDPDGALLVDKLREAGVAVAVTKLDAGGRPIAGAPEADPAPEPAAPAEPPAPLPGTPDDDEVPLDAYEWDAAAMTAAEEAPEAVAKAPAPARAATGSVSVEFDPRAAPLVKAVVDDLLAAGIKGVSEKRFPGLDESLAAARKSALSMYQAEGGKHRTFAIPAVNRADADAAVAACSEIGVATSLRVDESGAVEVLFDDAQLRAAGEDLGSMCEQLGRFAEGLEVDPAWVDRVRRAVAPAEGSPAERAPVSLEGKAKGTRAAKSPARKPDSIAVDRVVAPEKAREVNEEISRTLSPERIAKTTRAI